MKRMLLRTYSFIRLVISYIAQLKSKLPTISDWLRTKASILYYTPLKFDLQAKLLITINHLTLNIKE